MEETREEQIKRWEEKGWLDPNCKSCQSYYYESDRLPIDVFAPRHKASLNCESGEKPHCTCDTCF